MAFREQATRWMGGFGVRRDRSAQTERTASRAHDQIREAEQERQIQATVKELRQVQLGLIVTGRLY